jgi:hypothetical protein
MLSVAAIDAARHSPRLDTQIAAEFQNLDNSVFTRLQESDPVGAACLSRILGNGLRVIEQAETDPQQASMYRHRLKQTMAWIEASLKGDHSPGFAHRMVSFAIRQVDQDDRAILAAHCQRSIAEPLGLTVADDIHLPPRGAGMCHRMATKWAGCKVVAKPFKLDAMNVARINEKHQEYLGAVATKPTAPGAPAGHSAANREFIRAWLGAFTDANGGKHKGSVNIGKPKYRPPSIDLAKKPLKNNEVAIFSVIARRPDGSATGHSFALSAGEPMQLMDPGINTIFNFNGKLDPGHVVEQYYRLLVPDARLDWSVTRVSPSLKERGLHAARKARALLPQFLKE